MASNGKPPNVKTSNVKMPNAKTSDADENFSTVTASGAVLTPGREEGRETGERERERKSAKGRQVS